jgi:hypothetical protein
LISANNSDHFAQYLATMRATLCNRVPRVTAHSNPSRNQPETQGEVGRYTVTRLHTENRHQPDTCNCSTDDVLGSGDLAGRSLSLVEADECFRPDGDALEERAAIMELEGGLPRDIAEGLARCERMAPPKGFTSDLWSAAINSAARFADEWGRKALELGWTLEDLFGLNPANPGARYDGKGLAFVLEGDARVAPVQGPRQVAAQLRLRAVRVHR